jgi:hypothetical protein
MWIKLDTKIKWNKMFKDEIKKKTWNRIKIKTNCNKK